MTAVRFLLYALLTIGAGVAAVGLVRLPLRLEERVAMTPVVGVVAGTAMSALVALVVGVGVAAALGGPLLVGLAAVSVSLRSGDLRAPWRESWAEARSRWADRPPWGLVVTMVVALFLFVALFGHGIVDRDGGISSGYSTVWSDWAHHHTRAASFAVAHNLPPTDPLFAGTPLRYPFLPDFHTAMLAVIGLGPGLAYALPGIVLSLCITLLVISLAQRLGAPPAAGVIAAAICFVGGGLGFVGLLSDACTHHGFSADRCTVSHLVSSPLDGVAVTAGTLHDVPGVVADQPRAYDGLQTDPDRQPLKNIQWYTPLMAWWLPQTSIGYGFATALVILLLVVIAARAPTRQWMPFALVGALLGLLPWLHIHSFIALALVLPFLALRWRRREWLAAAAAATLIGLPRLLMLSLGPHGTAAGGNEYPWIEPGWMWDAQAAAADGHPAITVASLLRPVVSPGYWQFWLVNVGVAVPLCLVALLGMAARRGPPALASAGERLTRPFPLDLLSFCAPFMLIFLVANVVVLQSWDWDNTKVLVYWYLAVALLAGSLVSRWWRRREPPIPAPEEESAAGEEPLAAGGAPDSRRAPLWLRRVAAVAVLGSMVLSGVLVLLRLLPWTPAADSVGGPYTVASPSDLALAATVAQRTPDRAVFLTPGRPQDPVLTLAGRSSVMGYYGWLSSYGVDFGSRPDDVRTIYRGCAAVPAGSCRVDELLRRYDVRYVEVDDRVNDTGVLESRVDLDWWAQRGYPVIARSQDIVVYDVGRR